MEIFIQNEKKVPSLILKYEEPDSRKSRQPSTRAPDTRASNHWETQNESVTKQVSKIVIDVLRNASGEITYDLRIKYPKRVREGPSNKGLGRMILRDDFNDTNFEIFGSNLKIKNGRSDEQRDDLFLKTIGDLKRRPHHFLDDDEGSLKRKKIFEMKRDINGNLQGKNYVSGFIRNEININHVANNERKVNNAVIAHQPRKPKIGFEKWHLQENKGMCQGIFLMNKKKLDYSGNHKI